ncbi:MAG: hypothetical protein ACOC46_00545 [Pirellulales bacterium]
MTQRMLFPTNFEPAAPTPLTRAKRAGRSTPHSGSATSRAAAEAIRPEAGTLSAAVFEFIVGAGDRGATDGEIQRALHLAGDTERPRRRALQQRGLIIDSGHRRKTPSGREAVVWVSAPGKDAAEP